VDDAPAVASASRLIEDLACRLTEIRRDATRLADGKSWDLATAYVTDYDRIEESLRAESGKRPNPHQVNRRIRSVPGYAGPGSSWLSNAKRTEDVFPEVFMVNHKTLAYDDYRRIANCSLPDRLKIDIRDWAEKEHPTQSQLRERIRLEVDGYRPDFDLKVTNFWKFNRKAEASEFDGGIHPDLVANLIYYFTDPGDTILDPMAGGDTTHLVLQRFEFFHAVNPDLEFSGPRSLIRVDLDPSRDGIAQCDVREIHTIVDPGTVDLCILDPPYSHIAEGKYDTFGDNVAEWRTNIGSALRSISRTLAPGGVVTVIVDDYLRSREHHPLSTYVALEAMEAGYRPRATIYNHYPHAVVSMNAVQMARCKKARLLVNECKIIQVFEKGAVP
jgi:hypothetical protein